MFEHLGENGTIILNGDDDKLITVYESNGICPIFYHVENEDAEDFADNAQKEDSEIFADNAQKGNSKIFADNIRNDGIKGINCSLHYGEDCMDVKIQIPGKHMVYNAMAAMCVGKVFGLSNEEIQAGVESLRPVSGRNNIIDVKDITVIDDCYNANPVSMKASIDVLTYADKRKVAILGDMFELGKNEVDLHIEIGKYLEQSNIEVIALCGDLMNHAYTYLLEHASHKILYFFDKIEDLISELDRMICPEDTVLVKASHGMEFRKIIEYLTK